MTSLPSFLCSYQQDPFSSSLSTHSLHQIQQEPSNGLLWTSPPDSRGMSPCSTPSLANGSPNSTRQSTPSSMMDPNYGHHHYPQLGYHSSPRSQLQHQQHQQHQQYSPHMLQLPGGSSNSPQQLYGWSSGAMDMDSAQMHRRIQDQTSQYQMHQCQEMESEMGCGGPGSRGARSLSGGNLSSMEAMWRQQQLYHQQGYAVESPGSPNSHSPDSHWGSPCPTGNHVAPSHSPLLHNVTRTHRVLSSPPACGSPLASTHRKLGECSSFCCSLSHSVFLFRGQFCVVGVPRSYVWCIDVPVMSDFVLWSPRVLRPTEQDSARTPSSLPWCPWRWGR